MENNSEENTGYVLSDDPNHDHLFAEILINGIALMNIYYESEEIGFRFSVLNDHKKIELDSDFNRFLYVIISAKDKLKEIYDWKKSKRAVPDL